MAQHKWDERGVETGWCSHCVTLSEHTRQVAPLASPRVPDVAPAASSRAVRASVHKGTLMCAQCRR